MKVIQIPFCFYPEPVGGTEVYVEALSRHLQERGVDVTVAAPAKESKSYVFNQLAVRRFAISQKLENLRELYGAGDSSGAIEFGKILAAEKPDLIHLHALTGGTSLKLVRAAKRLGIPAIFTYHTPTVSCQRGTLLQWGSQVCDGKIEGYKCASCTLQGLGLSSCGGKAIALLPKQFGASLGNLNLGGGVWTALRMRELISLRHATFRSLVWEVDRIVAVCNWVKEILAINGVPREKITVSRQGLCQEIPPINGELEDRGNSDFKLRIAFLGRLHPTKGIHVLIRAFHDDSQLPAKLDIYGVLQGGADDGYQQELLRISDGDPRIAFKSPIPSEKVVRTLRNYDLLAVPSQWLETGPMVILEAFGAGIPVIGSDLGGIRELVRHDVDGLLVESTSIAAWSRELQRLCQDRELLERLKAGIIPPRRMETVAAEMAALYKNIGGGNRAYF